MGDEDYEKQHEMMRYRMDANERIGRDLRSLSGRTASRGRASSKAVFDRVSHRKEVSATPRNIPPQPVSYFDVGDKVLHQKLGEGRVRKVFGHSPRADRILVLFENGDEHVVMSTHLELD